MKHGKWYGKYLGPLRAAFFGLTFGTVLTSDDTQCSSILPAIDNQYKQFQGHARLHSPKEDTRDAPHNNIIVPDAGVVWSKY